MKKRESNHEEVSPLKQDQDSSVVTENGEPNFIQKNGKLITIASIAVVVIIGIALYFRYQSEQDSQRAAVLLTRVMSYYEAADYEKALNGDPTKTYLNEEVKGLKYIADQYGNTDQGKIAALYAANSLFNTDKSSEAKKYFETASGSSADIIKLGADAGLAAILETEGKYVEAAKLYTSAAELSEEENIKSRYMFYSALCYEKSGDNKQAETIYRDILKLYETSEFGSLAKAGLARIGTIIE
ncbi:MAG: tetratricopeptide repeat protein [Candidatus Kapaibacterium sp.]|jgi:tetratricopeptide (TPR) repeat protein|nr:tetratricopeptide repeat protein [Candidatus Kapabacteria bacterium]